MPESTARIDLRQEDYNRAAQAFYGGKAMTTTHRPYNADDTHDVNITATRLTSLDDVIAEHGYTREELEAMPDPTTTDLPAVDTEVTVTFKARVAGYNDDYFGTVSVEVLSQSGVPMFFVNVPREALRRDETAAGWPEGVTLTAGYQCCACCIQYGCAEDEPNSHGEPCVMGHNDDLA